MSVSCVVMWMFPVSSAVTSLTAVRRVESETHYSSVCLSFYRETDRSQTDLEESSFLLFPVVAPPPLCRKVTARLIGINQLAAPVEWRRRDLKRNGIDPKREVYTAPGSLVPIHLPQHNIIIPSSTTEEEEGASLGFLGQEQKAREEEKILN